MPKTRAGRDERDRDHEHNGKSGRRRERSLSRDREQSKKERPRSHDRGDKHREKKENLSEKGSIIKPIHIRADENVKAGEIYELTQLCKEVGYVNVKVRAIMTRKGSKD